MEELCEGNARLYVSLKVDVREMRDWTPERITLFFDGLTKMIASKQSPSVQIDGGEVVQGSAPD